MSSSTHNPEKRAFKGKSYKKGGKRVKELKDNGNLKALNKELASVKGVTK